MDDTQTSEHQVSAFSLYEEFKMRGINLDWYERRKHKKATGAIPLEDKRCSLLSIYLLKQDGSLWTVKMDGEPYSQVREPRKAVGRDMYVCACCKEQFNGMPAEHKAKEVN